MTFLARKQVNASQRIVCRNVNLGFVPALLAFHYTWRARDVNINTREHWTVLGDHFKALLQVIINDEGELPNLEVNVLDSLCTVLPGGGNANIGDLLGKTKFMHF